jgi:hypothetical protein
MNEHDDKLLEHTFDLQTTRADLRNDILISKFGRDVAEIIAHRVDLDYAKESIANCVRVFSVKHNVAMLRIDYVDKSRHPTRYISLNDIELYTSAAMIQAIYASTFKVPNMTWSVFDKNVDLLFKTLGKYVYISIDGTNIPLCFFYINKKDTGRYKISRIELCSHSGIYKLESKRLQIKQDNDTKTYYTLPMEWTISQSNDSKTEMHDIMTLAYPILNTLIGHPLVDFDHMWGWGEGAGHAHHEFCNKTLLSTTVMSEYEKLNKLEYANSIKNIMNSTVASDRRLYICIM